MSQQDQEPGIEFQLNPAPVYLRDNYKAAGKRDGKVTKFGSQTPMKRAGQPFECGTCYVFLASDDSSYIADQTLHPNGGEIVGG